MRAEWGNDAATASAARHRATLVGWMDRTRAALERRPIDIRNVAATGWAAEGVPTGGLS
jgi:hypothetical protein